MKYLYEAKDIIKGLGKEDAQAVLMILLSPREVPFEFPEATEYVNVTVDTVFFILDVDGIYPCIQDDEGVLFRVHWSGHKLVLSKFDDLWLVPGMSPSNYNETHGVQIVARINRTDRTHLSSIGSIKTFG